MRCIVSIGLIVMTLLSCARDEHSEEVLSQREMVKTLQELYIAEEHVGKLGLRIDSSRKLFAEMESRIFADLGVTDSTFKRSFDYYLSHPDQWEQVYSALVDSLNLREQRLSLPQNPE